MAKESTEGTIQEERSSPFDVGKSGTLILISLLIVAGTMFVIFNSGGTDTANTIKDELADSTQSGDGFETGANVSEETDDDEETEEAILASNSATEMNIKTTGCKVEEIKVFLYPDGTKAKIVLLQQASEDISLEIVPTPLDLTKNIDQVKILTMKKGEIEKTIYFRSTIYPEKYYLDIAMN